MSQRLMHDALRSAVWQTFDLVSSFRYYDVIVRYAHAIDLITLAQNLLETDVCFQASPGQFHADILMMQLNGLYIHYILPNRDIIFKDSIGAPSICARSFRTSRTDLFGQPILIDCPANAPSALVMPADDYNPVFEDIGPLADSPSGRIFWQAMQSVIEQTRKSGQANGEEGTVRIKSSDLMNILRFFGNGLPAQEPEDHRASRMLFQFLDISAQTGSFKIHELAYDLGMTTRNLQYCATRTVGVSPKKLLKGMALRNAMLGIKDSIGSGKHIGDVAFESGFDDFSRFCSDYRRFFGERPSDTMKRYRQI